MKISRFNDARKNEAATSGSAGAAAPPDVFGAGLSSKYKTISAKAQPLRHDRCAEDGQSKEPTLSNLDFRNE
jgi:hypothetical protein